MSLVGDFREEAPREHNSPPLQGANFIGDPHRDSLGGYFIREEFYEKVSDGELTSPPGQPFLMFYL